jgi:imidazoleglycerol-phosphate dehydratase/histidinol-phosphatase
MNQSKNNQLNNTTQFFDYVLENLNIKAEGANEHHKIEAIFKAFAKAIKMAVKRDVEKMVLPSTKGIL